MTYAIFFCVKCEKHLDASMFKSQAKDGVTKRKSARQCIDCLRAWHKEWARKRRRAVGKPLRIDPERTAVVKARKREKAKLHIKQWSIQNRERALELRKAAWARYLARNPGATKAASAKRRAAKKNATVSWDQEGILDVYTEAQYMQLTVDHIVPLTSKIVCGLHVWNNLQLLTAEENNFKRNKFNPETHVHTF